MNSFRSLCAAFALVFLAVSTARSQQSTPTNTADCLLFRNGDLLYGKLLAIDPNDTIRWQHPDSQTPIDFKPDTISQIEFPLSKAAAAQSNSTCRVSFGNGEAMEGNLIACDHDTLTIDTWYAGRLKIPRKSPQNPIQTIAFLPRQPAIFDGLTSLEGWTQGNAVQAFAAESGQWTYQHGGFYSIKPASIARDLKLPNQSEVQFDMAWNGILNLAIAFYTDSLQPILLTGKDSGPDFGAFYSLRFLNTVVVSLTPIRKKEPLRSLGDLMVPSLSGKDRVHVDVRMSKPDHRFVLFFDGALVKEWIDPAGFAGDGTGIRFVQNGGGALKISNLRVSAWNGILETGSETSPDSSRDSISMETGAKTNGLIQNIAKGQISFQGGAGLSQIAVNKVSAIEFASVPADSAKAPIGKVHATFGRGGFITFDLLTWRPDSMQIISPLFGKVSFDPAAFSRLQFLAPEPKKADEPKG
jgi:hypothetical protein